jgi:hypothetical protein
MQCQRGYSSTHKISIFSIQELRICVDRPYRSALPRLPPLQLQLRHHNRSHARNMTRSVVRPQYGIAPQNIATEINATVVNPDVDMLEAVNLIRVQCRPHPIRQLAVGL